MRVDDALEQILSFLRIAEEAKTSLGRPHENFDWFLLQASTNTPFTLIAVAEPVNPTVDVTAHVLAVKDATATAFRRVAEGAPAPGWVTPDGIAELRHFFRRNANGVGVTLVDFQDDGPPLEIDQAAALRALPPLEVPFELVEDIPARTAHGEIDGRLVAVGRYRNRPALNLRTNLYGDVYCVLAPHLVDKWGDEQRVSSIWKGKRLIVYGRLVYWKGGKLARVEADNIRERETPRVDIETVLDPDFTAGVDPVEYLDRLHEGKLG